MWTAAQGWPQKPILLAEAYARIASHNIVALIGQLRLIGTVAISAQEDLNVDAEELAKGSSRWAGEIAGSGVDRLICAVASGLSLGDHAIEA